jgi:hypothetical protein
MNDTHIPVVYGTVFKMVGFSNNQKHSVIILFAWEIVATLIASQELPHVLRLTVRSAVQCQLPDE